MATPATDKITSTFAKKYVSAYTSGHMFVAALKTIEGGIEAGKIYNQEFINAKSWVASGCEHAQHIASDPARGKDRTRSHGDCRDNIGYAFGMNQAAKMSRELKKLTEKSPDTLTVGIAEYIETLDQIDAIWKWLQSVKSIIVKGRKPNVNKTPAQIAEEMENTGNCAICERRQKLSKDGAVRTRTMVHHGYQMSDYNHSGTRMGQCFGAFKLPYEVSCEANKEFKILLQGELKDLEAYLKALNASKHDTLTVTEYPKGFRFPEQVPYARGTAKYEQERKSRIYSTENRIDSTKDQIDYQTGRIATWRAERLYDEVNPVVR